MCERCWDDAFRRSHGRNITQAEAYQQLLDERQDNPEELRKCGEYNLRRLAEEGIVQ